MTPKLLIVEDRFDELMRVMQIAEKAGFEDIVTASDLESALLHVPNVQAVATDLFFPEGNINVDAYARRILPLYVEYAQKTGKLPKGSVTTYKALESVSRVLGMTPEQYVEDVMAKNESNQGVILEHARASLHNFSQRYNIKQFLRGEPNLPLGVLVTEEAAKYQKPSVIVTSADDHGGLLTPLIPIVKVPYVCKLVNNQKDWEGGLAILSSQGY